MLNPILNLLFLIVNYFRLSSGVLEFLPTLGLVAVSEIENVSLERQPV
jgi:hypothetical protein